MNTTTLHINSNKQRSFVRHQLTQRLNFGAKIADLFWIDDISSKQSDAANVVVDDEFFFVFGQART